MATHEQVETIIVELKMKQLRGEFHDQKIIDTLLEVRKSCREMEFKIIKECLKE